VPRTTRSPVSLTTASCRLPDRPRQGHRRRHHRRRRSAGQAARHRRPRTGPDVLVAGPADSARHDVFGRPRGRHSRVKVRCEVVERERAAPGAPDRGLQGSARGGAGAPLPRGADAGAGLGRRFGELSGAAAVAPRAAAGTSPAARSAGCSASSNSCPAPSRSPTWQSAPPPYVGRGRSSCPKADLVAAATQAPCS
jgi:hypothetical protein